MKHYSLLAALMMLMLTGCNRHAEQMLSALEQQGVGLIVENNGETTTYCQHGVKDLLYLTANEPERLKGAVVADKIIGKAAAAIMATGDPFTLLLVTLPIYLLYELSITIIPPTRDVQPSL